MSDLITSPQNEKLKLARKLRERRWREREGLFVTEGEDLLRAGRASGLEPVALVCAEGSGLGGEEATEEALASASALGSGTRALAIWRRPEPPAELGPVCVYLDGVADPGNVGTVIRTARGLADAQVALGPGCADPYGPKAVRASMGSILARPPARARIADTPQPRVALVAHGGAPLDLVLAEHRGGAELTVCLGSEREGLPTEVLDACSQVATIPLRAGVESLNVAAVAAIALYRISSAAPEGRPANVESDSEHVEANASPGGGGDA